METVRQAVLSGVYPTEITFQEVSLDDSSQHGGPPPAQRRIVRRDPEHYYIEYLPGFFAGRDGSVVWYKSDAVCIEVDAAANPTNDLANLRTSIGRDASLAERHWESAERVFRMGLPLFKASHPSAEGYEFPGEFGVSPNLMKCLCLVKPADNGIDGVAVELSRADGKGRLIRVQAIFGAGSPAGPIPYPSVLEMFDTSGDAPVKRMEMRVKSVSFDPIPATQSFSPREFLTGTNLVHCYYSGGKKFSTVPGGKPSEYHEVVVEQTSDPFGFPWKSVGIMMTAVCGLIWAVVRNQRSSKKTKPTHTNES